MSVIIRKPTAQEIEEASLWKTWVKGISVFDMDYVGDFDNARMVG